MEKEQVVKTIKMTIRVIVFTLAIFGILYNIYVQNYPKMWDCAKVLVILSMYFDIEDLKNKLKEKEDN